MVRYYDGVAVDPGSVWWEVGLAKFSSLYFGLLASENVVGTGTFFFGGGLKNVAQGGGSVFRSIWTATKNKTGVQNALGHFNKHKGEFPEFLNAKQYVEGAKKFLNNPPKGTLTKTRPNGDTLRYNPNSNTFGILDKFGTPRTLFKPNPERHGYPGNLDYFNAQ